MHEKNTQRAHKMNEMNKIKPKQTNERVYAEENEIVWCAGEKQLDS